MKTIPVKLISPGYAEGRAVLCASHTPAPSSETTNDVGREIVRFERALSAARQELQAISSRVHGEFGGDEADIFTSHLLILDDPVVMDDIQRRIVAQRLSAKSAIQQSITEFAGRLDAVDDPYLRERGQDIRDIGNRLMRHLSGHSSVRFAGLEERSIIVAEELMPSDLVEVDHKNLAGIVTSRGGVTSHVGILSRSLGIPAATGIDSVTQLICSGAHLLIDGERSEIVVDPTAARIRRHRSKQRRFDALNRDTAANRHLPAVTRDNVAIQLLANLARPNEADYVALEQLEGVGLLRTEFLFLDHLEPPTVSLQENTYEDVARRLGGRELVIRTLDLGGDKFPLFLDRELEMNPGMGVRGVRFSLTQAQDLFTDQVKAVLSVARKYPVSLLLPMVVDLGDFLRAKEIIEDLARRSGMQRLPPLGVLVETPSAVLMIDEIVEHADFVSIGTNDLSQFILASDRNALESVEPNTTIHPSILRAVKQVTAASARHGKPVTVCGEAAGIPALAGLLVGIGVRRLSMSPASSPRVRQFIRSTTLGSLESAARSALAARDHEDVAKLIQTLGGGYEGIGVDIAGYG